jgi:hypothetical protein
MIPSMRGLRGRTNINLGGLWFLTVLTWACGGSGSSKQGGDGAAGTANAGMSGASGSVGSTGASGTTGTAGSGTTGVSGSGGTAGSAGASGGTSGSSGNAGSAGGSGGGSGTAGQTGTAGSAGGPGGTTGAAGASSGPCPDELGAYTVMIAGAGCGDLAAGGSQCIQAGATSCQVKLVSQGAVGSALNGTVDLDMNGSFASGAVKEGSLQRSGCTGSWNTAASQLTVDCGGIGTSQSCVATLVRSGKTCAAAPPCPDERGAYTVMIAGAGCGDLAAGAPQCIEAGSAACQVKLVSQGAAGSALNGTVDLDMSGNFASAAVKDGSVQRSGCTGTWNAAASQLTVDCGGIGTSQSCIATLVRTGSCP